MFEAQVLVADWRAASQLEPWGEDDFHLSGRPYNGYRPHSALGLLTPTEFAQQWRTNHQLHSHSGWTDQWGPVTP